MTLYSMVSSNSTRNQRITPLNPLFTPTGHTPMWILGSGSPDPRPTVHNAVPQQYCSRQQPLPFEFAGTALYSPVRTRNALAVGSSDFRNRSLHFSFISLPFELLSPSMLEQLDTRNSYHNHKVAGEYPHAIGQEGILIPIIWIRFLIVHPKQIFELCSA